MGEVPIKDQTLPEEPCVDPPSVIIFLFNINLNFINIFSKVQTIIICDTHQNQCVLHYIYIHFFVFSS